VFQARRKVHFFIFLFLAWFLLCKLLCNGFGELVSVMERDPSCSKDNIYEQCEVRFYMKIGAKISRERRKVERRKIYEAG